MSEADETRTVTFDIALLTASDDPITVNVMSQDGTATAGVDYEAIDTDLTFTGEMGERQQFEITVLDDDVFELRETVDFVLASDVSERIA